MPADHNSNRRDAPYDGCSIPPEIYDIAFGWDPTPEIQRLLFLCREHGVTPRSGLELGCGTGRLLPALACEIDEVCGIELSAEMAADARHRTGVEIVTGDMTDFDLGRTFDLICCSANTIRHVLTDNALGRMWRCVARHLTDAGIFIADLEFGVAAEAEKVGKPATWMLSRHDRLVHVSWEVIEPPVPKTHRCRIEWRFELRRGEQSERYSQSFTLRAFDAAEFAASAQRGGEMVVRGMYEIRDPYLFDRPAEKLVGRALIVVQRLTSSG